MYEYEKKKKNSIISIRNNMEHSQGYDKRSTLYKILAKVETTILYILSETRTKESESHF